MKPLSETLLAHYQQSLQTITRCVRIERQDGVVLGLTEHDQDLFFEAVLYQSAAGYRATAIQTSTGLAVGTVEIEGILSAAGVDRQAVSAGLFDGARIEVFEVNYQNLSQGKLVLLCGHWGEAHLQGYRYVTEFRSLAQSLQQPLGELYSTTCRAQLGDTRCGVPLDAFTHLAAVTQVISPLEIVADALTQADNYFAGGTLLWESGANTHLRTAIKHSAQDGRLTGVEPPPYPIAIGDAFSAVAGCDKRLATCIATFNNVIHFRGDPFVPGQEQLAQYPLSAPTDA